MNRGKGIYLFNNIKTFVNLMKGQGRDSNLLSAIKEFLNGKYLKEIQDIKLDKNPPQQPKQQQQDDRIILLQKYIDTPMLIDDRKFDLRIFVLVDHDYKYYVFKEGYIRMASEEYDVSTNSLSNIFVHLTNNAIQKLSKNYGKYESANILSFDQFDVYLLNQNKKFQEGLRRNQFIKPVNSLTIMNQIKEQIKICFSASKQNMVKKKYKNVFEIFGFDFMVNNKGRTFLIEVNTNPCIEEPCTHVSKLLTRMLNDAFRLTVDQIFSAQDDKRRGSIKVIQDVKKQKPNITFPYYNYPNEQNLWEELGQLYR